MLTSGSRCSLRWWETESSGFFGSLNVRVSKLTLDLDRCIIDAKSLGLLAIVTLRFHVDARIFFNKRLGIVLGREDSERLGFGPGPTLDFLKQQQVILTISLKNIIMGKFFQN